MLLIHVNGQHLSSYNLQHLPQRSAMNPSFMPHGKMHIGIPVLSGISYNYINSGFRYSDLLRINDNQSLYLDIPNAISKLNTRNHLSAQSEIEILAAGMKIKKSYFSLNATEKVDFNFNYSKSTIEFLFEGNAATAGTTQQLNPGVEAIHYREYGLAWAFELNPKITTGIRAKYLYGMEHALSKGEGVTMYTDPVDFTITASSDYTVYTSGLDTGAFNDFGFGNYAIGKKNSGIGIDAGITYKVTQSVEISASVIDFGKINWSSDIAIYETHTSTDGFTYSGINLNEFINNDSLDAESYLENIADSLYNSFHVTTSSESYSSQLPMQVYLNGSYLFSPRYKISALVKHKTLHHNNTTDFQVAFTGKSKTWLNYTIAMNKLQHTPATLGAGFALNFHNSQLYFVSDNVPGIFNWKKSYSTGFRTGINMVFGTRLKNMKPPQPKLEAPE